MTFDEWWEATKNPDKVEVPGILKKALKELAYEAWCESRYQQNRKPKSTDPDRSWACPNCGAVHDPIDEHYLYCHFCGKGRF